MTGGPDLTVGRVLGLAFLAFTTVWPSCYLDRPRLATRVALAPRRTQRQQNVFRLFRPAN